MTDFGEKLANAINFKADDVNSFVWKGEKKIVNGEKVQEQIKLMDATPEQLNKFYKHCNSMLYNKDKDNPGRYVLLDIIKEQRVKCCAELFLRYLENNYLPSTDRKRIPRFFYLQSIKDCLQANQEALPYNVWSSTPITAITGGVPDEFSQVLDIQTVMNACVDSLGLFSKKHITLNFILKMGVSFTPQEWKDLTEKDANGNIRDRRDVIRERLNLKNNAPIRINPESLLTYSEFRSMILLKNKRYSALTNEQLLTLRNKVLFKLEDEALIHIEQWKELIRQIKLVADARGITLDA